MTNATGRTTSPNSPAPDTLPDLLQPGLDLVFVGISPAEYSARVGHYYSHSNNDFWEVLSASSLVPERVRPKDDRRLPADYGIGLTDVVKRVVTDSKKVSPEAVRAARPDFERRIAAASPRMICFNGKQAFEAVFPGEWRPGQWGCQRVKIAGAQVWVMPSTSGAARRHREHNGCVLEDIARALGRAAS